MKLNIVKNWTSLNEPTLFSIELSKDKAKLWYKEMMIRFWILNSLKTEEEKQKYMKTFNLYDIDEWRECWKISYSHFKDMLSLLFDRK